jgi:hypothetical protein
MNPTSTEYKMTGKEIPLNVNILVKHIHNKLDEYAFLKESTQTEPGSNPFTQPVIFTTDEGKLVQVPAEIQKQAISTWKQRSNPQHTPSPQGQPDGVFEHFGNPGTPLEQTSHMAHLQGAHDQRQLPPQQPMYQEPPVQQQRQQQPMYQEPYPDMPVNRPVNRLPRYAPDPRLIERMEEPPQRVVVVEKDNSTILYMIVFIVLAALAYYVYTSRGKV